MATTINGVTVRLGRSESDWRKYEIVVQVLSRRRKSLKSTTAIDPGLATSTQHLVTQVNAAGAAGAEYLGQRYGDNIDPLRAGLDAVKAFYEECRLLKSLSEGVAEKLKRLEANLSKLSNAEVERLHRLRWLVDRQSQLTMKDVRWIDERIGQVHGASL